MVTKPMEINQTELQILWTCLQKGQFANEEQAQERFWTFRDRVLAHLQEKISTAIRENNGNTSEQVNHFKGLEDKLLEIEAQPILSDRWHTKLDQFWDAFRRPGHVEVYPGHNAGPENRTIPLHKDNYV